MAQSRVIFIVAGSIDVFDCESGGDTMFPISCLDGVIFWDGES